MVTLTAGIDDGLGKDLGVLFRLRPRRNILCVLSRHVHIPVDQCQQIAAVGAGGVSQVDDRHMVAVIFLGYGAIVSGQIAFGIQRQKTHPGGTGILQVGIEKVCRFSHAAGADHQAVDIVTVHQSLELFSVSLAAQNQPLYAGALLALSPRTDLKGHMGKSFPDLPVCGPAGGPVLTVAHGAGLDPVQGIEMGEGGKAADDQKHGSSRSDQQRELRRFERFKELHPIIRHGICTSCFSAIRSSFQSLFFGMSRFTVHCSFN